MPITELTGQQLTETWRVNSLSHHLIFHYFHHFVLASQDPLRAIVSISSSAASVKLAPMIVQLQVDLYRIQDGPLTAYNVTKQNLSMINRLWAVQLEPKGIRVMLVHPGLVYTDFCEGLPDEEMQKYGAISLETSTRNSLEIFETTPIERTSEGILGAGGSVVPW